MVSSRMVHVYQGHEQSSVLIHYEGVLQEHLEHRVITSHSIDLTFLGGNVSAHLRQSEYVLDQTGLSVVMQDLVLIQKLGVLLEKDNSWEYSIDEPVLDLKAS